MVSHPRGRVYINLSAINTSENKGYNISIPKNLSKVGKAHYASLCKIFYIRSQNLRLTLLSC